MVNVSRIWQGASAFRHGMNEQTVQTAETSV